MPLPSATPVPQIRPISDLRTDLNSVCDQAQESQQPIYMTKNGKSKLVVFDSDAYENQQMHERYVAKLREAEIEARYRTETFSQDAVDETMERIFAHWGV
ncbi:MAG: type II toxin-antitoxin system Phd/YefM family antitoxin [Eggerthellaceae bacterium]|nr:type II toxin-antitoxin system Phd/YefM family antitoxin [Eggerthellaceae bacterium]